MKIIRSENQLGHMYKATMYCEIDKWGSVSVDRPISRNFSVYAKDESEAKGMLSKQVNEYYHERFQVDAESHFKVTKVEVIDNSFTNKELDIHKLNRIYSISKEVSDLLNKEFALYTSPLIQDMININEDLIKDLKSKLS